MGLADLLKLSAELPAMQAPAAAGGMGGIGGSIAAASNILDRFATALERLVDIEKPATTSWIQRQTAIRPDNPYQIGPAPFISRWVDVYVLPTSGDQIAFQFLDPNMQRTFDTMVVQPGQFLSFPIQSRGYICTQFTGVPQYQVTFWS